MAADNTVSHLASLPDDALIDVHAIAAMFGCTRQTIYRAVNRGRIPAPIKLTHKIVRWRIGDIRKLAGGAA